jgi:hypothetical protein
LVAESDDAYCNVTCGGVGRDIVADGPDGGVDRDIVADGDGDSGDSDYYKSRHNDSISGLDIRYQYIHLEYATYILFRAVSQPRAQHSILLLQRSYH